MQKWRFAGLRGDLSWPSAKLGGLIAACASVNRALSKNISLKKDTGVYADADAVEIGAAVQMARRMDENGGGVWRRRV